MKLNAGMIIGLIGGLIGAAVGIASAFMTEPIVGVIITVVMVGVFYMIYRVFIKPSLEYSHILKTGIQGTGRITELQETNTRINNQPLVKITLEVTIPGRAPYTASTKTVISYFQIASFQPGAVIPVMVDNNDPTKVVLVRKGDLPEAQQPKVSEQSLTELREKLEEMEAYNQGIRATGTYCKAIVTKYTFMGVNVNGNNPLATLEIQVLPDTEPAFGATVKAVIKETNVPLYQPGEEIFVKYDPYDKSRVAIEHS